MRWQELSRWITSRIEFDKKNKQWHVHHGYLHSENSEKLHDPLSADDEKLLEKVKKIWHNRGR